MSRLTDEEILVELRDFKQRIASLIADVSGRIAAEEAIVDRIMQEVRGLPAPNDHPIPSRDGHPPTPAHICCDAGDDVQDMCGICGEEWNSDGCCARTSRGRP